MRDTAPEPDAYDVLSAQFSGKRVSFQVAEVLLKKPGLILLETLNPGSSLDDRLTVVTAITEAALSYRELYSISPRLYSPTFWNLIFVKIYGYSSAEASDSVWKWDKLLFSRKSERETGHCWGALRYAQELSHIGII